MNILIVEDEQHTAALLKEIIEQDADALVVASESSVIGAVDYLIKYQSKIDLIFMDIQLSDGHSFEIFKQIDIEVPVIFCTSFDQYGMDAIQNNGIDYILKPFEDERVHQSLEKYRKSTERLRKKWMINFTQDEEVPNYQKNFLGQKKEKSMVVAIEDIAMFSLEYETTYLYTFKNEKMPIYKTLEYVEQVVDPDDFFRINRQMIVGKKTVKSIEPYFNRKIALNLYTEGPERPVVSRLKVTEFKVWLQGNRS